MSEYVRARRVLLNVLEALGPQRQAVILCGAQAVYLRAGEDTLAVAPFTTDADLVVTPSRLLDEPLLQDAMERAGIRLSDQPGIWRSAEGVEVDLLVPDALGGRGRRAAKLGPPHGDMVARKVRGLEAALIDHSTMLLGPLDTSDERTFEVAVAGPSALVVAKLHKIADRAGTPGRARDKDALDLFRILRAVSTEELAAGLTMLAANSISETVTHQAISFLDRFFAARGSEGTLMAVRATELLEDPEQIAAACVALTNDLLTAVR